MRSQVLFAKYESALNQTPGILITQAEKKRSTFYFRGIRDPVALDPLLVLKNKHLDPSRVVLDLKPFISADPALFQRRLRSYLAIPSGVEMKLSNGVIQFSGVASYLWIDSVHKKVVLLSSLIPIETKGLKDSEYFDLIKLKENIEGNVIRFRSASIRLSLNERSKLTKLVRDLTEILRISKFTHRDWTLVIRGYSDPVGSTEANQALSQKRAAFIASTVRKNGIPEQKLQAVGLGSSEDMGRVVRFKISFLDPLSDEENAS